MCRCGFGEGCVQSTEVFGDRAQGAWDERFTVVGSENESHQRELDRVLQRRLHFPY
jgi:hypothetical protein